MDNPQTPSKKMHDYRKRMQASGLRLVQFWVPDTRREGFAEEAKRQSLLTRHSDKEALDFIEQAADW